MPCYERPPLSDMERGMKLLNQELLSRELRGEAKSAVDGEVREGWDRRWKHPPSWR